MFREIRNKIKTLKEQLEDRPQGDAFNQLDIAYEKNVLDELSKIFDGMTDQDDCIKEFETFLSMHWELIKDTHLDYFSAYDNPVNNLLIMLAKVLAKHAIARANEDAELTPKSAVEYLMPSINTESTLVSEYPHLYCTKDKMNKQWLDVSLNKILKNYFLGESGKYLIPIRLLCNQPLDKFSEPFPNVYFELDDEVSTDVRVNLSDREVEKLKQHSDLTEELYETVLRYQAALADDNSLYKQLMLLQMALYRYSKYGDGSEQEAAKAIDISVQSFFEYYEKLDNEALDKVPKDLARALQTLYDYNYGRRVPDIGSCATTRRLAIEKYVIGNEDLLSTIVLSKDESHSNIRASLNAYEHAKAKLVKSLDDGTYRHLNKSRISLSLFDKYNVKLTISSHDFLIDALNRFSSNDLHSYLSSISHSHLIQYPLDDENFIVSIFLSLSYEKLCAFMEFYQGISRNNRSAFQPQTIKNLQVIIALFGMLEPKRCKLLASYIDLNKRIDGLLPLQAALLSGYTNAVGNLRDCGAKLYLSQDEIHDSICYAARSGYIDIIDELLPKATDEHQKVYWLNEAMLYATTSGNEIAARQLIDKGADVYYKDSLGNDLLSYACVSGNENLMDLFLQGGNDINGLNSNGNTKLFFAALSNNPSSIMFVISKADSIDVNHQDNDGDTALHDAVRKGAIKSVEKLIALGADVLIKNKLQQTPVLLALESKHFSTALYLLKTSYKQTKLGLSAATINGETALLLAAKEGQVEICSNILSYGLSSCQTLEEYQAFKEMINHKTVSGRIACSVAYDQRIVRKITEATIKADEKIKSLSPRQHHRKTRRGFFLPHTSSQDDVTPVKTRCAIM